MGVNASPADQGGPRPGAEPSLADLAEAAALRDRRFRELVATVTHGAGVLPSGVRESLVVGTEAPEGLAAFVAKVADGGLAVTDEDVAALLAAGYTQDAVFECVIAVAVAAGGTRLRTVERLLAASS